MKRGIVMIRANYARNQKTRRRNKRPKSAKDLSDLLKYFDNAEHENHTGISILKTRYWRTAADRFVSDVAASASGYKAAATNVPGAKWNGDIAEHLIAAPDKGSNLTEEEVCRIANRIMARLSPRSPAAWAAHFHEETKTWEMHFAISSFTEDLPPNLRVADLRRRNFADYGCLIDEAGFVVLNEINRDRVIQGRPTVRLLGDLKAAKIKSLTDELGRQMARAGVTELSVESLLRLFAGTQWKILRASKSSVSAESPNFSTPLHIRWHAVLQSIARLDPKRIRADVDRHREPPGPE